MFNIDRRYVILNTDVDILIKYGSEINIVLYCKCLIV